MIPNNTEKRLHTMPHSRDNANRGYFYQCCRQRITFSKFMEHAFIDVHGNDAAGPPHTSIIPVLSRLEQHRC